MTTIDERKMKMGNERERESFHYNWNPLTLKSRDCLTCRDDCCVRDQRSIALERETCTRFLIDCNMPGPVKDDKLLVVADSRDEIFRLFATKWTLVDSIKLEAEDFRKWKAFDAG